MEAVGSSKMVVPIYQATWHHVPEYNKFCSQLSIYFKKHMAYRSKRTLRLCCGQLERLKPCKKISRIGFSWMKTTTNFRFLSFYSFWITALEWYFFYLFSSALPIGSIVGWGPMLQTGRSQHRIPMRSFNFSIDLILPAALWPWVDSASNRNENQEFSWR
jgi:hypothetical protein